MTAYTKTSDFAIKDSLLSGNPSKVVRGTEIDTEFNAIQAADADNVKISGLATGVATFLDTPTSANLAAVLTDETGSGAAVFATSPTLVTPALGTPSSATLTNATGLPAAGVVGTALVTTAIGTTVQAYDADLTTWAGVTPGTGVATALAVNVGSAGAPVVNGGVLGTPSSGTVTNLTGTASININGTVGATTPAAGTFTTLTSTGNATLGDAEASDTHAIKGATTLLANSASAALTVTQTGAGNAFVVEDSASPDGSAFVIDGAGFIAIQKAISTSYKVDIGGSGDSLIRLLAAGQGSGLEIGQLTADGGSKIFVANNNYLALGTNNTERMRIDSAGKVTGSASYVAHSATAIPAGGTAGAGVMVSSTANFGVFFGSGVPTLSAAQGSLYLRSDGSSTSTRMYVNTNGSTTWTAVTTAA